MKSQVFRHLLVRVCEEGYTDEVEWARNIETCESADDMAWEYIWVVCNSGMKNTVAETIYWDRVRPALLNGQPVSKVFKHLNKAKAIENAWKDRRMAEETGERVAVVDTVIWRACERGLYKPSGNRKALVVKC